MGDRRRDMGDERQDKGYCEGEGLGVRGKKKGKKLCPRWGDTRDKRQRVEKVEGKGGKGRRGRRNVEEGGTGVEDKGKGGLGREDWGGQSSTLLFTVNTPLI